MEKQLVGVPARCCRKAQLYRTQTAVLAYRGF